MARITVEDCIDKFESRFELVLVASNRARKLHSGESPTVEKDNDKPTVIALREIAEESLSVDHLKDKLIQEYQTVSALDEEELSLDYTGSETQMSDKITDDESQFNKVNAEDKILNEDLSNEVEDESSLVTKSEENTDTSGDNNSEN
jgi:DNA-directed RNA polymerase subunit omega